MPVPPRGRKRPNERVILCSGKVYYDLVDYRAKNKVENTAIIRIEQLYPLHKCDRLNRNSPIYGRDNTPSSSGPRKSRRTWARGSSRPELAEIFGFNPIYAGRFMPPHPPPPGRPRPPPQRNRRT